MVTQTEVKMMNTGKATDNGHMTQEKATDYRNAKQKNATDNGHVLYRRKRVSEDGHKESDTR